MAERTERTKREEMMKDPLFCDSNGRCKTAINERSELRAVRSNMKRIIDAQNLLI